MKAILSWTFWVIAVNQSINIHWILSSVNMGFAPSDIPGVAASSLSGKVFRVT